MKKIPFILLVALGLQTKAQINVCDSISYTTTSTINYPLILSGSAPGLLNMADSVTWVWQVCNSTICYSATGENASFGQVSTTDTLKVCYDVIIHMGGMTYVCTGCDSLVYNQNSYQWEAISAHPVGIAEYGFVIEEDGVRWYSDQTFDLLGREIFEIPKGTIYIKNRKKFIK